MKQNKEEKINKEREIEKNKNKKGERDREREREREKGKLSRKKGRHWTLVSKQRQSKLNTNKTKTNQQKQGGLSAKWGTPPQKTRPPTQPPTKTQFYANLGPQTEMGANEHFAIFARIWCI